MQHFFSQLIKITFLTLLSTQRTSSTQETCSTTNCDTFGFQGEVTCGKNVIVLAHEQSDTHHRDQCTEHLVKHFQQSEPTVYVHQEAKERSEEGTCDNQYGPGVVSSGWDHVNAHRTMLSILKNPSTGQDLAFYVHMKHLIGHELKKVHEKSRSEGLTDRLENGRIDYQLHGMKQLAQNASPNEFPEKETVLAVIATVQSWRQQGMTYTDLVKKQEKMKLPDQYRREDSRKLQKAIADRTESLQLSLEQAIRTDGLHIFQVSANYSQAVMRKNSDLANQVTVLTGLNT